MTDTVNAPDASDASFRAVISGRVQGVGFRYFVQKRAVALGIAGVVFNRADGAVEVLARADRAKLDAFLAELRRGPAMSRVNRVEVDWEARVPPGDGFRITHG